MRFKLPKDEQISPNHSRKISEVLPEFAEEIAPRNSEPEVFHTAATLAMGLWNLALVPRDKQAEDLVRLFDGMKAGNNTLLQFRVQELLELRKTR
jgi:hypothetical protein